jgi:hypothetical protein
MLRIGPIRRHSRARLPPVAISTRHQPASCGSRGSGDGAFADGLAAWMGGQPQVAASAKRSAGIRGELDHFGVMAFLQGLLTVLRDAGHPGLVLVTGTPAFFDGPSGVQLLAPLAGRLATDFGTDARFDNPRAVQIRLPGFDRSALVALGAKVRDLFAADETGSRGRAGEDRRPRRGRQVVKTPTRGPGLNDEQGSPVNATRQD